MPKTLLDVLKFEIIVKICKSHNIELANIYIRSFVLRVKVFFYDRKWGLIMDVAKVNQNTFTPQFGRIITKKGGKKFLKK